MEERIDQYLRTILAQHSHFISIQLNYDKQKGQEFDESCSEDDHTEKGANDEDLDDSANTGKDKISRVHSNVPLKGWEKKGRQVFLFLVDTLQHSLSARH